MWNQLKRYLPWGDRAGYPMAWALAIGFGATMIGFVAALLELRWLGIVAYCIVAASVATGFVYVLCGIPVNIFRSARTFMEYWNRPPRNRHDDWKP